MVLEEMGQRIKDYRLQQNTTQIDLAENAGVSLSVVQRCEAGKPISTFNLIAILRELGLLENLDTAFPKPEISPILLQKMMGKQRQRASNKEE